MSELHFEAFLSERNAKLNRPFARFRALTLLAVHFRSVAVFFAWADRLRGRVGDNWKREEKKSCGKLCHFVFSSTFIL